MNPFLWLVIAWKWLWRKPLTAWVRTRMVQQNVAEAVALDPNKPVCYVLPARSWADRVVLERTCAEEGLPEPYQTRQRLPNGDRATLVFLPALTEQSRRGKRTELQELAEAAINNPDYDIQLVPVSVYWGRDPGKETSLFKILFTDSPTAGWIRKAFIVLANGRHTFVGFGKPISFSEFMADQTDHKVGLHKLARVLGVHFRRTRTAALGPSQMSRPALLRSLVNTSSVRAAIADVASQEGMTEAKAQAQARKYADEIASNYSTGPIRFMELVLEWLWEKMFDGLEVYNIEKAQQAAHEGTVIYMPSHRSHFDYLLLTYVLYENGLAPPHIAAGININFWPVGGLMRRCGAFYMRRTFKGNRLYAAVFRAYVDSLIAKGVSIEFYPEGGRSRTGRLRKPAAGVMSMIVESALRHPQQPVKLVPVFIGYDRIMEVNSYFKELRGVQGKQKESAAGLLKVGGKLKRQYGKPYISFGEPIDLHQTIGAKHPDWRTYDWRGPDRPDWWKAFIGSLVDQNMRGVNTAAVVSPVAITALALLSTQQRALGARELDQRLDALIELQKRAPYSSAMTLLDVNTTELQERGERVGGMRRAEHPWGEIVTVDDKQATLLTYYRNSIQHLFALPSLLANFFGAREVRQEDDLLAGALALYPMLRDELFVRWDIKQVPDVLKRQLDTMIEMGFLRRSDTDPSLIMRPDPRSKAFGHLNGLMRIMRESIERYAMTLTLLVEHSNETVERKAFEQECSLMGERMAVLTGRNAPEFFDAAIFRGHVDSLLRQGLLHDAPEAGKLVVDGDIEAVQSRALALLGAEVAQTVLNLSGTRSEAAEQATQAAVEAEQAAEDPVTTEARSDQPQAKQSTAEESAEESEKKAAQPID